MSTSSYFVQAVDEDTGETRVDRVERWKKSWETYNGKPGFHESDVNPNLGKFWGELEGAARVAVPLCGKSLDLRFLREKGFDVVGIEGVERAIQELKEESLPTLEKVEPKLWKEKDGGISVIFDDFFEADVGQVDAIYDRAAMVAIPPSAREAYVAKHREMLRPGGKILLVTLDAGDESGPPFSIGPAEVKRLFSSGEWEEVRAISEHPSTLRGGTITEYVHLITLKL